LGPVAQIQIFGERVTLPASCVDHAGAPPDSSGPVEIQESLDGVSGILFYPKMTVDP
jgi:hypothetical protein